MATLIKGLNAVGTVLEIKENYDKPFTDTMSEQGGTRYCHWFTVAVDGAEYPCQYCSTDDHLTEFRVGDTIDFKVKSFSRNVHTIGLNSVKRRPDSRPEPINGLAASVSKHMIIAGTPEAIGLQCAVQIYANRLEIDSIAIADLAHELTMYLRTEYETNTNPNF